MAACGFRASRRIADQRRKVVLEQVVVVGIVFVIVEGRIAVIVDDLDLVGDFVIAGFDVDRIVFALGIDIIVLGAAIVFVLGK